MRVIEQKMLEAIRKRRNFKLSNTRVEQKENGFVVWLYNTPIYAKINDVIYVCDDDWNTTTTQSRLNALGIPYSRNYRKNPVALTDICQMRRIINNA
ncbi:MAG: hypothetical protein J5595_03425 [Bacteroidales bacterium]|nr:hypothetical protein [Bacteroidales bacterium]